MAVKRSVLEIDVDDRKFKQYLEAYNKYKASVDKLPIAWGSVTKENKATVEATRMMTASMMANMNVMRQAIAGSSTINDNSRKTAAFWKQISEHTRNTGSYLHSQLTTFLRWTGIGSAISGLALGGSVFGLERFANAASVARRSATGLGVTYGQQAGFGLAYNRLVDASTFMGAVSTGRGDISSQQASTLYSLGVMGKGGTAETSAAALAKIREMTQAIPKGPDEDRQLGFLLHGRGLGSLGLSVEDLRRMRDMSGSEFGEYQKKFSSDSKSLNITDATLKRWQDFNVQLETAGERLKKSFIEGLVALTGPLSKLSDAASKAVDSFMKSKGFQWVIDKIAHGLEWFADYVSGPGFKQDMKDFGEGIANISKAIIEGMKWLGLIPSGSTTNPSAPTGPKYGMSYEEYQKQEEKRMEGQPDIIKKRIRERMRGNYEDYLKRGGEIEPGTGEGGNTGQTKLGEYLGNRGDDVAAFMRMGWSKEQAAGIVANIQGESSGDPRAVGDKGLAYGLAQWHPDRQAMFRKVMGKDIRQSMREEQLKFIDWELRNSEAAAGMRLAGARTAGESGAIVSRYFERPLAADEAARNRSMIANTIYGQLPQGQPRVDIRVTNNSGSNVGVNAASIGVSGTGLGR